MGSLLRNVGAFALMAALGCASSGCTTTGVVSQEGIAAAKALEGTWDDLDTKEWYFTAVAEQGWLVGTRVFVSDAPSGKWLRGEKTKGFRIQINGRRVTGTVYYDNPKTNGGWDLECPVQSRSFIGDDQETMNLFAGFPDGSGWISVRVRKR
jgi:hypothetical protein